MRYIKELNMVSYLEMGLISPNYEDTAKLSVGASQCQEAPILSQNITR